MKSESRNTWLTCGCEVRDGDFWKDIWVLILVSIPIFFDTSHHYNKNIKIIKVKRETRTFFLTKLCKINYKKLRTYVAYSTGTGYRDSTVLVSSEDTSAPTVIENLEWSGTQYSARATISLHSKLPFFSRVWILLTELMAILCRV